MIRLTATVGGCERVACSQVRRAWLVDLARTARVATVSTSPVPRRHDSPIHDEPNCTPADTAGDSSSEIGERDCRTRTVQSRPSAWRDASPVTAIGRRAQRSVACKMLNCVYKMTMLSDVQRIPFWIRCGQGAVYAPISYSRHDVILASLAIAIRVAFRAFAPRDACLV